MKLSLSESDAEERQMYKDCVRGGGCHCERSEAMTIG